VEGSAGPDGACGTAAQHARHAHTGSRRLSVMEVRTVRSFRTETCLLSPIFNFDFPSLQKFHRKFVLIEEIMGNPFCLNQEKKL
jgi:hypothetical protein